MKEFVGFNISKEDFKKAMARKFEPVPCKCKLRYYCVLVFRDQEEDINQKCSGGKNTWKFAN